MPVSYVETWPPHCNGRMIGIELEYDPDINDYPL